MPADQLASMAENSNDALNSLQGLNDVSNEDIAQNVMILLADKAINGADAIDADQAQSIQRYQVAQHQLLFQE